MWSPTSGRTAHDTFPHEALAGESPGAMLPDLDHLVFVAVPGAEPLTPRELQIARLLARGNTYRGTSEVLGISVGTVQTHAKSICRRLGVHSKQELVEYARTKM